MKRVTPIFFLLLFFSARQAFAQNNLRFEHIGIKEGLSSEKGCYIFQDSRGFIWFGTGFGLNRFDGISCKTWYHDEKDSNSLVSNRVLSLAEDADHHLWIGTREGVSCFDPITGKFTNYYSGGKGKYNFGKEYCFTFVDKTNKVWVGSNSCVSWFDTVSGTFHDIPIELTRPGTRRNLYCGGFFHDSRNRLWVATSYGVNRILPEKGTVISYHLAETGDARYTSNAITQVVEDRKGRIFAGTWNGGMLIFDEMQQQFVRRFVSMKDNLHDLIYFILPFVENNTDYLWLATASGLLRVNTEEVLSATTAPHFQEYLPDPSNSESISSKVIYLICRDRTGNLWISTESGVDRVDPLQQQFQILHFKTNADLLPEINSMASGNNSDEIYFFTSGQLFLYNKSNAVIRNIPLAFGDITDAARGKKYYWISSFRGLWQCDSMMRPIKKWLAKGFSGSSEDVKVRSVLEDQSGNIWCGLWRGGIIKIDPETGRIESFLMKPTDEFDLHNYIISKILEDRKGNLWFGSNGGLYQYRIADNKFYSYRINKVIREAAVDGIESLEEGKDGKIWIGSRQGLRYYDYATDKMTPVDFGNTSINNYISGVVEDHTGILWLATDNGLLQYNPSNGTIKRFTTANGLKTNNLTELFTKDKSGMIYIGSKSNVTYFDPVSILKNKIAFIPIITGITIDNKAIQPDVSLFRLKYNQGLSIDFAALNYSNASNNQYAYRLKGDKQWKFLGNNRSISFANLSPGNYELQIKASNSDGVWNETPAVLKFKVSPPFWKTWWFIGLLILSIAAVVYAFYRNRLQRALEMERLRTRIATDLHDDIGATLSSISMYSEAVKEQVKEKLPHLQPVLDKMGENSRSMVGSMSDIVWAINPGNDEGQKLLDRMEAYGKDICAVKHVKIQFDIDEKINEIRLPLEHRKNIYLLFKESLNNALKYSGCDAIFVQLHLQGNQFYLNIKDNGHGFDLVNNKKGNGLKNMQARAGEIRGKLHILSSMDAGTEVKLECPIA